MSAPVLFVAGTDTGVGKTRVATALCRALAARGLSVGAMKPAETGCEDPSAPADALALREASGSREPLELLCPYRLREPLAPAVAARREGVEIDLEVLAGALESLRSRCDLLVCEGAGGLLVPLSGTVLTGEWLAARSYPVLLVGRLGLGTINHTLLSARWLRDRGVPLLGSVLCATEPDLGLADETNPATLAAYPEARLLGVVAHGSETLPEPVVRAALSLLA